MPITGRKQDQSSNCTICTLFINVLWSYCSFKSSYDVMASFLNLALFWSKASLPKPWPCKRLTSNYLVLHTGTRWHYAFLNMLFYVTSLNIRHAICVASHLPHITQPMLCVVCAILLFFTDVMKLCFLS